MHSIQYTRDILNCQTFSIDTQRERKRNREYEIAKCVIELNGSYRRIRKIEG